MKSLLILGVTTALLAVSGLCSAASDTLQRTLTPITVSHGTPLDCTPPSSEEACAFMHAQIRHVFNKREIGMLFGARSSYPEYLASYEHVSQRYQAFLHDLGEYGERHVALVIR
jgi:hypothetical protein